eukprot:3263192-Lingulodinium_polyedra.AAC.1
MEAHDVVEPTQEFEGIGLNVDGRAAVIANRVSRTWELYLAVRELVRRGRGSGWGLRRVAGRLAN